MVRQIISNKIVHLKKNRANQNINIVKLSKLNTNLITKS